MKQQVTLMLGLMSACGISSADSVFEADTVVVSASRSQQELLTVPETISVVDEEKMRRQAATTAADALKDTAGVRLINDGTPGVKRVSLRGESGSHTAVMADGERINDQKNKSGTPLLINPFFIDRVEVIRGPASVLYGSDAIGGIVNVITPAPAEDPFAAKGGLLYSGANEGFSQYGLASGTIQDFSYVLGAFNQDMGDMYLKGHDRLDNTSFRSHGFNGVFNWNVRDNLTLSLKGESFDLASHTATTARDSNYKDFKAHMPKWQRDKLSLGLDWRDINEYLAVLKASVYIQNNDKIYKASPTSVPDIDTYTKNNQDSLGGNLQTEWSLGDSLYLTAGYDGREDQVESTDRARIKSQSSPVTINSEIVYSGMKQQHHALYALASWNVLDELILSGGLRYNYITTDPGNAGIVDKQNFSKRTLVHTVGSAGLTWQWDEANALRFNFSQGFRAPTLQELFMTTRTVTEQQGNPNLKPERSYNYELGFRHQAEQGFNADLSLFYSQAYDYIDTKRIAPNPIERYQYENIAKAKTIGLEAELSYNFGKFAPYTELTLMDRRYEKGDGFATHKTGTPHLFGRSGLIYQDDFYGVNLRSDAYVRYASRSKDQESYIGPVELAGYAVPGLELNVSFGAKQQYKIYAVADNLLDKRYQSSELIEEPGRNFSLGGEIAF